MNTRKVHQTLFRQLVLSLERADADCASLTLDADDLREIRLCAESHDVAQFARYARPCVVIPANDQIRPTAPLSPSTPAEELRHLKEVARANGFESITDAIVKAKRYMDEIKRLRRVLHDIADSRPDEHMDVDKTPELVKWICETCRNASVRAYPPRPAENAQIPASQSVMDSESWDAGICCCVSRLVLALPYHQQNAEI